jgi:microcompartment protein CcmL/EutN
MDSTLCIHRMGENIIKVFPNDTHLIGRPLDEVFRLIQPDIHVEWDKVYQYFLLFHQLSSSF